MANSANREYLPFIDWMKCAGITLIVVGHVAAAPFNHLTPPIYPKQLGVAFFIFVMGFSLSRETRRPLWVLFNRLFELYFFGIAIAILMSAIVLATRGTPNLSNYLPFMLGANVLFDNFPANPTTWYIGTYLHVLLLWAVFVRRLRLKLWMLAVSMAIEVGLRALLLATAGNYVAYMLFPNWITVFLFGTWFGQRSTGGASDSAAPLADERGASLAGYPLLLAGWAVGWALAVRPVVREFTFPFMRLSSAGAAVDALTTSVAATAVYLVYTLLFYQVVRGAHAYRWVQFIAHNTIIVFIAHMPLFYGLAELLAARGLPYGVRSAVYVSACLVGLAWASEGIRALSRPAKLRDHVSAVLGLTPQRPLVARPM